MIKENSLFDLRKIKDVTKSPVLEGAVGIFT